MPVTIGVNSYVDETSLENYATLRGITIEGDKTQLLIKAMDYIEIQNYHGLKYLETQALQFPRSITVDGDSYGIVPTKVINAQMVAALLIDTGENLNPVVDRATKREKIDVLEIEYQENSSETKVFTQLDLLLSPYLLNVGGSFDVVRI